MFITLSFFLLDTDARYANGNRGNSLLYISSAMGLASLPDGHCVPSSMNSGADDVLALGRRERAEKRDGGERLRQ